MTTRKTTPLAIAFAALFALLLPLTASAQNGPWWGGGRDRDRDYRRDRDYDRGGLRNTARRLEARSRSFQHHLDSALDRSRIDDTRREDNINQTAREFRNAADRFEDRIDDNGRDFRRGESEARQMLAIAARLERQLSRVRLDSRAASDWSQIRNDLRTVANVYNLRVGDFDDDYYRRGDRNRRNNGGWRWPGY
jgi:predicted ribosome quality control (RQC) complex YloA/Tae2 family protein